MVITPLKEDRNIQVLTQILDSVEKIVVVTHIGPDGDAIGSSTAFASVMQRLGKEVHIIIPDMMLATLRCVPGAKEVIDAYAHPDFATQLVMEAEMIVGLDFNHLGRIGKILGPAVEKSRAKKVLIDHHENPEQFADVVISHPECSSTCYLLYKVFCAMEINSFIEKDAATSILTGMMTDTGNFAYNCSDPELYIAVCDLMRKGADKERIYKEQFNTHSLNCLRLNAYAILDKFSVMPEFSIGIITLMRSELNEFHYTKGDTEGLVNKPLEVPGIEISLFLREEDGYVKASMRTTDNCRFANRICHDLFGGGGHDKAAGGEFTGTLEQCLKHIVDHLPEIKQKYLIPAKTTE